MATLENLASLLMHKLARRGVPRYGEITFSVTVKDGQLTQPRLIVDDRDDEREFLKPE